MCPSVEGDLAEKGTTAGDTDTVHARFAGLTGSIEVYPQALTFEFESLDAGWDFWERTNPPLMAI